MKVHFIAIGGSIMHSLAIALKINGHDVSGSDDQIFDPAKSKLESHNLLPEAGWHPDRITKDLDVVILGMHAFTDNPELARAKELGLPIYSFPEFIAKQSEHKQRIVIAGSAGKTTITSMVMHVLQAAGKEFDYLVGAQIPGFDNPVRISDAPIIIVEGDEYLSSRIDPKPKFLHYKPNILAISNISWDHINVFPTEEVYLEQFEFLLQGLEKASSIIYHENDERLSDMVKEHTDPEIHYLYPYKTPAYKVEEEQFEIDLHGLTKKLKVIGAHNMANVNAAWKTCELLGVSLDQFLESISSFEGAGIRLEIIKENPGELLIRDYAHAPSKVKASVDAVKSNYPDKNVIACLELHTFSSLNKNFIPHYKGSLVPADHKLVFVNPKAIEKRRMEPIEEEFILESFGEGKLVFAKSVDEVKSFIQDARTGKDVILMMSSGNFGGMDLKSLI
ncbi:MAG: Mur ligase family protein [Bacteroidia bacterium]|nr:Mur ligase family protein [Bacteroidia bacterium]